MNLSASSSYPLTDLCTLADMPIRTVRYYMQIGLVDKPEGETRAARYGNKHLEQLLLIKKWTTAGVSLERIRELLQGETPPVPARLGFGSVQVCSHLRIAEGIELVIEPIAAQLSPEQVRQLAQGVLALISQIQAPTVATDADPTQPDNESTP
jgi:DNA-binding transcriptional MerR regulator